MESDINDCLDRDAHIVADSRASFIAEFCFLSARNVEQACFCEQPCAAIFSHSPLSNRSEQEAQLSPRDRAMRRVN